MTHKDRVKQDFRRRVDVLKTNLPNYYGVIVKTEEPDIKPSKIYNLLHRYTHDEDLLKRLEEKFNK